MKRKTAATCVFLIMTASLLFSAPARADLCVLKNGDYTLSSKYNVSTPTSFTTGGLETESPCSDADADDGASDDNISLEFSVGSDIEVDLVYEQDATEQYRVLLFNYVMFYDTTNMSIGDVSSGDCNPDPAGFFNDDMCFFVGVPCCGSGLSSDGTTPAVVYSLMNFSADKWPAEPANFILDQLVFANTFSQGSNLYDITFEETGAAPTDVGVVVGGSETCGIFSGAEKCADYGVTLQDIMTSSISVAAPSTWVGPPTTASVSCSPDPVSCAADPLNANATVTLTYSVATQQCYETSACSIPSTSGACVGITSSNFGINFTDMAGNPHTNQNSGTFTESVKVGTRPTYTLTGVHLPGSLDSCSATKIVTAPAPCACGEAPEITLISSIGKTYYENSDISITFKISDEDSALSAISEIKFYYTNDINTAAQVYTVNVATEMDSEGNLTVKIPKEFISEGIDIYFGMTVKDEYGLTGSYPSDFTLREDGLIDSSTSEVIDSDNCKCGVYYREPYPNQFPFMPGDNGNNPLLISFMLEWEAEVTMRVYTMDGRLVRTLTNTDEDVTNYCSGEECNSCNWYQGCVWDGSDMGGPGNIVGNGMYIINIHAISANGQTYDYTKGIVVMR